MAVGFHRPGLFGLAGILPGDQPDVDMGDFPRMPPRVPAEPFVWGAGGARMNADQIEQMRKMAMAEQAEAGSFAPVAHWTQGLARSLGAVTGGLRMRRADKAGDANAAESQATIAALLAANEPGADPAANKSAVLAALANPYLDERAHGLAEMQFKAMQPKQSAPHYWETNDGSLGMVGADGKPAVLYKDPTPKVDYITADNGDGTKQLIPVVNGQIMGGGGQASGAAAAPTTLPSDFFDDDNKGGPAATPGTFR